MESCNSSLRSSTMSSSSVNSNFPVKLHYMLNELEKDGLQHIACWQRDGYSFIVNKPKDFESIVLPFYFQQSKFTSFQRQLNFYGFNRIKDGKDKGSYYHENFRRDNHNLSYMIRRVAVVKKNDNGLTSFLNKSHQGSNSVGDLSMLSSSDMESITTDNSTTTMDYQQQVRSRSPPRTLHELHPLCKHGLKKPRLLSIEAFHASIRKGKTFNDTSSSVLPLPSKPVLIGIHSSTPIIHNTTKHQLATITTTFLKHPFLKSNDKDLFHSSANNQEKDTFYHHNLTKQQSCINFRKSSLSLKRNNAIAYSA